VLACPNDRRLETDAARAGFPYRRSAATAGWPADSAAVERIGPILAHKLGEVTARRRCPGGVLRTRGQLSHPGSTLPLPELNGVSHDDALSIRHRHCCCGGVGGGAGSQISMAYCDGVPYPDGSYWHAIQYGAPMIGHPYGLLSPGLQCVVPGGPVPQPAPPGGCGGAV